MWAGGAWRGELFWKSIGKRVAHRNLWIAVPALLVAFVVRQVWSVTWWFYARRGAEAPS
ncbi:hypothetical protein [Streptomyces sp. NPDC046712]|uniref:hypothetical protein n=1 Tax=Streptomyces sp. NPDC046712 TaxID=3154802 RepID=UPI0033FFC6B4